MCVQCIRVEPMLRLRFLISFDFVNAMSLPNCSEVMPAYVGAADADEKDAVIVYKFHCK